MVRVANSPNGGFITAFPCGEPQPKASMLNYTAGQTIANGATIKLGTNGTICIFTLQPMDLIVDVTGYLPAGTDITPITPARCGSERIRRRIVIAASLR